MTFFYDLNKRMAELSQKQTLAEHSVPAVQPTKKSPMTQALNERDMGKHNNATTGFAALAKKAGKEYGSKAAGERVAGAQFQKMKKAGQLEEQGMEEGVVGNLVNRGKEAYNTYQANRGLDKAGAAQDAMRAGKAGATWQQLGLRLNMHHGQVSGALSNLHKAGEVFMLRNKYNKSHPYVAKQFRHAYTDEQVFDERVQTQAGKRRELLEQLLAQCTEAGRTGWGNYQLTEIARIEDKVNADDARVATKEG
jgi:hypothetical protein